MTTTLLNLLRARVDPLWAAFFLPLAPPPVTYTGVSPSTSFTADQALGMFLYYAHEDPHFKNLPPVYRDQPPIRFTPMGVILQYQLFVHAAELMNNPHAAALRAQRLFGLALKTLHDFPSLDRNTSFGGLIFPTELQNTENVFRITMRNIAPNEASNFWTAGTQAVRLASYYEVTATLIEPDRPQVLSGRVLRYGIQIFVHGAPHLDTSRATVTFRIPGETSDRTVEVRPGEAAIGEDITFEGTDLAGDSTTLLIKRPDWNTPQEVGLDWGVAGGNEFVVAQVHPQASAEDIVPGFYTAAARVTRFRQMPDGSMRAFPQVSNEVPFVVAPQITNPPYNTVATAVGNIVTVTGGVFQHADVLPENVRVIVGGEPVPIEPTLALTAGHFEITSATQIRIQFPIPGLASGATLPLRVIVNGAENSPRWVQVP
ncbi:MAG TPA: Pvc16 family protein [Pyrinomonadaceae bacterium]|nr:Pvc16 family protein [Pyrinomonadaceae bacterium]